MNQSRTEKKKMHRVQTLREQHGELDGRIDELSANPCTDPVLLAVSKKQRLHLRDQILHHAPQQVLA